MPEPQAAPVLDGSATIERAVHACAEAKEACALCGELLTQARVLYEQVAATAGHRPRPPVRKNERHKTRGQTTGNCDTLG